MPRAVSGSWARLAVLFVAIFSSIQQIGQCQRLTGIYVDNGMGQTVAHRVSSRRETRNIARDILDMLQLPTVPARSARFGNVSMKMRGPASRYIQDVYKYNLNENGAGQQIDHEEILKDSDVVVSYAASTSDRKDEVLLQFDLSETPADVESVIGARLRLHLGTRGSDSVVSVHALMSSKNKTNQQQQQQRQKRRVRLVDSVKVSSGAESRIELDVTEAMRYWLSRGDKAATLRLSIAAAENGTAGHMLEEPFLVGYFKSPSKLQQAAVAAAVARRLKRSSGDLWTYSGNPEVRPMPASGQCQLRTLYVRFRELEFDRMIVAPDGYNAQFCGGECRFPLSAHQNATNHAIVQTLVHFLQPSRAPPVCCVPTKHDPMTVIYSRDGRNHVLKRYHSMVISGCGCH